MTRDECKKFVAHGALRSAPCAHAERAPPDRAPRSRVCAAFARTAAALALAMSRDHSSGGVIRMLNIDEHGVEREFIAGDRLPVPM